MDKKPLWRYVAVGLVSTAIVMLESPPRTCADASTPQQYSGTVDFVSDSAVEVNGHRGLIGPKTIVISDRRSVSLTSVHTGMQAELEVDSDGQALLLKVQGAIE